ncbi:hypothetical protein Leryth_020918 [Lithospermum erythrorhizon]|nr:hypothetical protein Leryth_020918 [Lithospermum erythrorhizon]
MRLERKFGLLLACKDSDYVKKMYGGYFNVFVQALAEEGEIWDLYRVVDGEFPDFVGLHMYDGFVISGSPYDAYSDECWIQKLCSLVQLLHLMETKIMGICFGHQVLCRALGGKVAKACTGWDLGIRQVNIEKELLPWYFTEDDLVELPSTLKIIECHRDEVWEMPEGAKIISSSDKTRVEMFSMDDHILGIQGHPEYTKDILHDIIDRLHCNGCIESGLRENVRETLVIVEPDSKNWEKICKRFLKG